jgi:hypothetical protein
MKFYKVDMQGKFYMNRGTLPAWVASDEGRLFYDSVNKKVYYADQVHWVQVSDADNPGPAVYS